MNSTRLRNEELGGARERKAMEIEVRKDAARRAYEGGDMTMKEISRLTHTCESTLKAWKVEGGWGRAP